MPTKTKTKALIPAGKTGENGELPKKPRSKYEQKFIDMWLGDYPEIDLYTDYRFCPPRRFQFDLANLEARVAIEINGGNWSGGRHTRPAALKSEYEKGNLAVLNGWRVFVLSPEMITTEWLELIAGAIQSR